MAGTRMITMMVGTSARAAAGLAAMLAAALLGSYVSERNHWMLRRHALFQDAHSPHHPLADPKACERWRGHPHFDWAATFVERYDQAAIDPHYDCAPLSHFEPMVMRLFARTPRVLPLD